MTNIQRAFLSFWSSFHNPETGEPLPAYPSGQAYKPNAQGVLSAAELPYITFDVNLPDYFDSDIIRGKVWTHSTSPMQGLGIVEQIRKAIPHSGRTLTIEGSRGAIQLWRSTPFVQSFPQDDFMIKAWDIGLIAKSYIL